jgi:ABC-type transport system substrate-binding protein
MMETLLSVDRSSGEYVPQLASSWEMSPDAKTWTFQLVKNAGWHFGFGTFTAKDVVHSWHLVTAKESIATDAVDWRRLVGKPENFQVVDDHKIVFNLVSPEPDLAFYLATRAGNLKLLSKQQWDQGGQDALIRQPAGTGPYRYKNRQLGQFILFERVENHYRRTPDFKELMLMFALEDSTRLAAMLAAESHITDLPRALHDQAIAKGMKRISSKLPGTVMTYMFGGSYFATPEKLDTKVPWLDAKVRQAMNRAVNRKDIIKEIFDGRGVALPLQYYHPSEQGWSKEWEARFEELYGYDPKKAKALLAEAGYPDGFKMKLYAYSWSGTPELLQVTEALALYFREIGIEARIEELEYARVWERIRQRQASGEMWGFPPFSLRPPHAGLRLLYYSKGAFHVYEHPFIDERIDKLSQLTDPVERARLQREIGEHLFVNYAAIPIATMFFEAIVNPAVVAEYTFSGSYSSIFSDLEYVKPVLK